MTEVTGTGRNIWDVIFSLEKRNFPIQRNYLREPRGSLNPINSQDTSPVCQKTVDELREKITDPCELYALDFELNYTIRVLSDYILYVIPKYALKRGDLYKLAQTEIFKPIKTLSKKYDLHVDAEKIWFALFNEVGLMPRYCDTIQKGHYMDISDYKHGLIASGKILKALEYTIETSTCDWKTKAEAFLRTSSLRKYAPADDETIIYLMSQKLNDPELKEEALCRQKQYRKEWNDLFFTDKNPFDDQFSIDRLRLIHWNTLGNLRFLDNPVDGKFRETHRFYAESHHLLSSCFLTDFTRVFSLFRTDLNVDPVRSQLEKVIRRLYQNLYGLHYFSYSPMAGDLYYLSNMLFSFVTNRIRHDFITDQTQTMHFITREHIGTDFQNSTADFLKDIPHITMKALEVHSVSYTQPAGYIDYLQNSKKWLLEQQTAYGYWYDGIISPEYTTVLVLDALNLIERSEGLTFPLKQRIELSSNIINLRFPPVLIVDNLSNTLIYGSKKISLKVRGGRSLAWDFITALIVCRFKKMPLSRFPSEKAIPRRNKSKRFDWKNQYDYLANRMGGSNVLKQFITSTGNSYILGDNVQPTNYCSVWTKAKSSLVESSKDPKSYDAQNEDVEGRETYDSEDD